MAGVYSQIRELGAEVVAVSFSPPERIAAFLKEMPQPIAVLADPTMTAYRYFAIRRAPILSFLRWHVLRRYLGLMLRGWRPGKPAKGDDLMQLGGDFVLDAAGRLTYSHPSGDAGDRPTMSQLLEAVRGAGGTPAA